MKHETKEEIVEEIMDSEPIQHLLSIEKTAIATGRGTDYRGKLLQDVFKEALESYAEKRVEEERRLDQVNRVEVINNTVPIERGGGRAYVFWEDNVSVTTSIQDKGRTLKVFINNQDTSHTS